MRPPHSGPGSAPCGELGEIFETGDLAASVTGDDPVEESRVASVGVESFPGFGELYELKHLNVLLLLKTITLIFSQRSAVAHKTTGRPIAAALVPSGFLGEFSKELWRLRSRRICV
jgi:hypothetical protein